MKKFSIICGLALAMLTAGCSKDATTDLNPTVKTSLSVSLDQTRTYLDGVNILWSEGDKVAINGKEAAIPAAAVGTAGATFEGVAVAEDYSVFYPAELLDANFSGNNTYTIPVVQGYTKGSFAPDTSILVGYAEHNETKTSVALNNVYGYLKIVLSDAAAVSKVYLSATAGEAISGTFTVDYKSAAVTPLAGESIIRIMGVEPADGVAEIVVAVPAGEYAQGFTVKAIDTTGKAMTKTIGKTGIEVERAQLYVLPELAYEGSAQSVVSVSNATELIDALVAASSSETPGNIVIESDIDMSAVTEYTPKNFYGTIDGQGYVIKNWTTNRGLINQNRGVVKNITIAANCTLTSAYTTEGDKNLGFVVENNYTNCLVSGCVNNGKVIANDISCAPHRIGGVIGVSYGIVKNCTNNGDVSITSTAVNNAQFIGGVIGYSNTSNASVVGKDFIVNCINNGDVTVTFPITPMKMCIGGVLGSTQVSASSAAVWLGTIKNCINNGKVLYSFDVLSSGTYANIGGIVGYAQADIVGCDNYGEVEYSLPYTDRSAAATRAAAGGIVGCNIFGIEGCNNYGILTIDGVWGAAGSDSTDTAYVGPQNGSSFGGVVGCTGVYNVYSADYPIENCNNYGEVDINCYCKTDGATAGHFGGVVGYTTNDVINCQNHGTFTSNSIMGSTYAGGVVGWTIASAEKLENHGTVSITIEDVSSAGKDVYLAGVAGYAYKSGVASSVTDCYNNGTVDITIKDAQTNNLIKNAYISGIVGYAISATNCHNNGTTTMTVYDDGTNGTASGALYSAGVIGYARTLVDGCSLNGAFSLTTGNPIVSLRCAGVVGQVLTNNKTDEGGNAVHLTTVSNCSTTAKATVSLITKNTKASYTAGIAGLCNNGMEGCTNKAAISATASAAISTSEIFYVAGVVGRQAQTLSGCHNEGNIVADMANSTSPLYAGGVLGLNNAATSVVTGCTNSGDMTITNISTDSENLKVGGVVGYDKGTTSDSSSTGTVKVNGETI